MPAVATVAAVGLTAAAARADDHAVTFPDDPGYAQYAPPAVEAAAGDTVTFGGSFASHPLVWDDGDFATQRTGSSHQFGLSRPGRFRFHCELHPGVMFGSVHVAGNAFATPDFAVAPDQPQTGAAVTFTAGSFTDPDGSIARYEWDLDGNGSFETSATAGSVTRSYASPGTVHVALRYVDDGHETSPATIHDVVVTRPGGSGGGGSGGGTSPQTGSPGGGSPAAGTDGGGSPAPSSGAPGAGPAPGGPAPDARVLSRALAFRAGAATASLAAGQAGTLIATLRAKGAKGAKGATLARGAATAKAPGTVRLKLRLTRTGRARVRAGRRIAATLTVVVRDTSGRTITVTRAVTLRRG